MQRRAGDHDEILTVSLWETEDAIKAFAGDDITRAVFYPEDYAWLTGRDLQADHWEVVGEATPRSAASHGPLDAQRRLPAS
jgi:hypothetical protein